MHARTCICMHAPAYACTHLHMHACTCRHSLCCCTLLHTLSDPICLLALFPPSCTGGRDKPSRTAEEVPLAGPFSGGRYVTAICNLSGQSTAGYTAHGTGPGTWTSSCGATCGKTKHRNGCFSYVVGLPTKAAADAALKAAGGDAREVPQ